MTYRPSFTLVAVGDKALKLFQKYHQALESNHDKKIRKYRHEIDVISKRQVAQLKRGVPLESLS